MMPGPQLAEAITLTQQVKRMRPELPVIWGGYFPTLHTDVVLKSGIVDYVIRGEGEWSFAELIDALHNGKPVGSIPSLSHRLNGRILHNPKRAGTDPNDLPPLPYHRINIERYLTRTVLGSRRDFQSSLTWKFMNRLGNWRCVMPGSCRRKVFTCHGMTSMRSRQRRTKTPLQSCSNRFKARRA